MIPKETIDQIRDKTDIVSLISEYVPLKKRGRNYLGSCPFHNETKPSFTVSQEKQLFHCFGCGEGGGVFAFLQKIESVSFIEAVQTLGQRLGIAIQASSHKGDPVKNSGRENYYMVMDLAAKYYEKILTGSDSGRSAQNYLEKRGIDRQTARLFRLGYAPSAWDSLYQNLKSRGISDEILEKAGLIIKREGKEGYYDRFRDRLMFPIRDTRGRVIAFSGRTLGQSEAKYINSPDSPIYRKGESLYALFESKDEIRKAQGAILVEGNVDVIALHQFGIGNTIAPLGTAFTPAQAKLINRFTSNIILAFDADLAGGIATERSIEILRNVGIEVKVAALSEKDPDELIRSVGAKEFFGLLKSALPWLKYKISLVLKRHNTREIEGRVKAIREIGLLLSKENDRMVQLEYAKEAARDLGIDKEDILSEVRKASYYLYPQLKRTGGVNTQTEKPKAKIFLAEETLLKLAIENNDVYQELLEKIKPQEFITPEHKQVAEILFAKGRGENGGRVQKILENLTDSRARAVVSKILLDEIVIGNLTQVVEDCLNSLKAHHLGNRILGLKAEIRNAEKEANLKKVENLHREYSECSQLLRRLEKGEFTK